MIISLSIMYVQKMVGLHVHECSYISLFGTGAAIYGHVGMDTAIYGHGYSHMWAWILLYGHGYSHIWSCGYGSIYIHVVIHVNAALYGHIGHSFAWMQPYIVILVIHLHGCSLI